MHTLELENVLLLKQDALLPIVKFNIDTESNMSLENEEITGGYGSCRSCDCKGYQKSLKGDGYCSNCNHKFDQHRE